MAEVRQRISLTDKMSPVLLKIVDNMKSTLRAMNELDKATSKGANVGKFREMSSAIQACERDIQNMNRSIRDAGSDTQPVNNGFNNWRITLLSVDAALRLIRSSMRGLKELVEPLDHYVATGSRLGLIKDEFHSIAELQGLIMKSADEARATYIDMARDVSQMGIAGRAAFEGNNEALVRYVELLNKVMVIGGAGSAQRSNAMLQISQALSMGKLRGQEFRSVLENATVYADLLAKELGVARGELLELASDGAIGLDTMIGALLNYEGEINKMFEMTSKTSETWGSKIANAFYRQMGPVFEWYKGAINSPELSNDIVVLEQYIASFASWLMQMIQTVSGMFANPGFALFAQDFGNALLAVVAVAREGLEIATSVAGFVIQNWSLIGIVVKPVVAMLIAYKAAIIAINVAMGITKALTMGLAVINSIFTGSMAASAAATTVGTGALWGLNAALWANPAVLIILKIVAVISLIVAAIYVIIQAILYLWNHCEAFRAAIMTIVMAIIDTWYGLPVVFWTITDAFATAFENAKMKVLSIMDSIYNGVISILNKMIAAINQVAGTSIEAFSESNMAAAYGDKIKVRAEKRQDRLNQEVNKFSKKHNEKRAWANNIVKNGGAASSGASATGAAGLTKPSEASRKSGADLLGKMKIPSASGSGSGKGKKITGGKLDKVSKIGDMDEALKYLKDIAHKEYVNKYVSSRPLVQVSFGDVHETADVNEIEQVLTRAVQGAYKNALGG